MVHSIEVAAPRRDVWRAVDDADAVGCWRPGVAGHAEPESGEADRVQRYPLRVAGLPLELRVRRLSARVGVRVENELRLGLFRCRETFTLQGAGSRTHVTLKVSAPSEIAVIGGSLDRFGVRSFASRLASEALEGLRAWCEHGSDVQILSHPARGVGEALAGER